ncbi:MAG: CBS and ACT domain-containing protein [Anaerolineae bacterium]|jgi:acetoin utilization protein AcuB|nr:CBS domain-containing protein [Chloroflexota bacterium]
MLVKDRMSRHPITIRPDLSLADALRVMRDAKVRRLPVVDREDRLVGIVLEKDLLYASPSPATSLSVYELNYLVSRITVDSLMTRDVVTVSEDTALEEAARIMADHNIGGLPVMRDGVLVGMITESDLFKVFIELLGARDWGLRVTLKVADRRGVLAKLSAAITATGADIVALSTFWGDDPTNRDLVIKIQGIQREQVEHIIEGLEATIVDIRETQ